MLILSDIIMSELKKEIVFFEDFDSWMSYGIKQGWCGPAVCYTHDGLPLSLFEEEEMYEGDPCVHIVRLYEDKIVKELIEDNHSPSKWRNNL